MLLCLDRNGSHELAINIHDDGVGFDVEEVELSASSRGKWGLMSMRQRATSLGGSLTIRSIPNQGTNVIAKIPFRCIEYNI